MEAHRRCCGDVATRAIGMAPWHGAAFDAVLEGAYLQSERRGCQASGWRRRLMIYLFVLEAFGWAPPAGDHHG